MFVFVFFFESINDEERKEIQGKGNPRGGGDPRGGGLKRWEVKGGRSKGVCPKEGEGTEYFNV